ncbi:MAG: DNA-directed RNA polymerase subunit alpha [Synergistaceae bacterium]|nr:DNA-directed RNA polymerase subunit alpha [Synergistaceae bacterium]
MLEKTKFEVYIEEKTQNYGKIFLEPLERGYGDTLGNALRRLLLSSIRGAAVTAVRIDGVLHEFSTIKGIREDVIEILMNLKQIPIKAKHDKADEGFKIITLDSDFLPKNFFTRKENPGVITAADLPKDNDFEFCGDNVLCTLEPDAHLLMEIYVEQGVGYLSSERERPAEPSLPIDALLTDAIFSPVKRVNYQIEPARVGKSIDYERLVLEVWTNGAITPEEAVKQASEIAEKCFNKVSETVLTAKEKEREKIEIPSVPKGRPGKDSELPKTFDEEPAPPAPSTRPISEIGLTVRAANCLLRGGIATLQDLLDRSHEDLLKLRNLGKKSLKEIEEKVEDLGYVLAPSPEIEETEAQPEDVKQEVKEATEFSSKKDPKELLADIFIDSDNAVQEAEDLIKAKNKEEEEKPAKEPTKKTAKSTRVKKSDKSDVKAEEVKEEKEKVEVKEESKDTETEAKSAKKKTSRSKKSEKTEPKVEEVKEEVKEEIKEPETEAKTEKKKSSRSKKSEKSEVKAEEVKEVKEVKETKKEKAAKTAKGKAKKEVEEVKEEVKKPEPEPEAKVEKVEAETEAKPEKKKSSRAKKTEKSDVKAEEVKEVKKVKEAKVKKEKAAVKEEKSEKADKTEKTEKPAKTKATKTKKAAESDSDKKKSASKSKTAKTKKEKDRKEGA